MNWRVVEVREKGRGLAAMWSIKRRANLSRTEFYAINKRPSLATLLTEAQAQCDEYNKREAKP